MHFMLGSPVLQCILPDLHSEQRKFVACMYIYIQ
jgi:hypothetical protein